MMTCRARGAVLPLLCCIAIAGCGNHSLKDSAGERLSLSSYDRLALQSVEVDSRIARAGVADDLAAQIRARLSESKSWGETAGAAARVDDARGRDCYRQADIAVSVLKAVYPSRSKIIWLGSAHKMTCRLEVRDHASAAMLGSVRISSSIEPLMGNAALLNFGAAGILVRTAFDTRERDARSLLADMAKKVVSVLDRAKK